MDTLFPVESNFPEGFTYLPEFLTGKEEIILHKEIEQLNLHSFYFQGFKAKRKVASFGYDWSFENKKLSKGKEIPAAFNFLIAKVSKHLSVTENEFAELLVTEYPVGSVINWHRDAPPFDLIAGISLLTDCTFRFRPHDKTKQGRSSVISFPVHKRSLYVMKDKARTDWEHSVSPVNKIRYSITLRTLKAA